MAKRIVSGFLCCLFCCLLITPFLIVPAKAVSLEFDVGIVDLFDWALQMGTNVGKFAYWLFFDRSTCVYAPEANNRHNFIERHTAVDGKPGYYYICEYCGISAGEVGQDAYTDYVDTLPATGYMSDGSLLFYPSRHKFYSRGSSNGYYSGACPHATDYKDSGISGCDLQFNCDECTIIGTLSDGSTWFRSYYGFGYDCYFECPITGWYSCYFGGSISGYYMDSKPVTYSLDRVFTFNENATLRAKGAEFSHSNWGSEFSGIYFYLHFSLPVYKVVPYDSVIDEVNSTYNITTRPTTITGGNYGIVGDDGQLTIITVNDSIVNEYNNTYYNPATGQGDTITNWTYDYIDRSYNVTLESGDTVTVTYGDQNITIVEGGDTYIIYYVIDGGHSDPGDDGPVNSDSPSASDSPTHTDPPSVEEHSWRETDRKDPTCTLPGQINFICEHCDQLRVDVIPANGHTWVEKQHVPTTYDDEGNLIQWGYTIYECSVCGEQYKDVTGAGPPGSGSGTADDGGLAGWINSLIKSLSDNLSGAVELILSFFRRIPELFSGFTAFLSAMFPFLPDDVMFILTFGIAAVVFIGIIKAIRR